MSASSSPDRPSSPHVSSDRLAATLYRVVERTMLQEFADRYDAGLLLRCLSLVTVPTAPEDTSVLRFRIDCRGLTEMVARMAVTRSPRGTYDVLCTAQDGNAHSFSYQFPIRGDTIDLSGALVLGNDIATFFRTELENRVGRLLLQSPACPSNHSILGLC